MTDEQRAVEKSKYTRKIEIPIYEPKNIKPFISELYDRSRTDKLKEEIEKANIPDSIKQFLFSAAERHTRFNFSKIADFYAHSEPEIKRLFEDSALVILDYNDAIQKGFISYQKEVDFDLEEYLNGLTDEDLLKNITSDAVTEKMQKKLLSELL